MMSRAQLMTFRAVVVVEATSGLPLVAGSIGFVAAVVTGSYLTTANLLPGWGDPLNASLSAALYLSPVAAGIAAAHAGFLGRSGASSLAATAPDGEWRMLKAAALATWMWAILAYVGLVSVVMITADLNGPFAGAMTLLPLQGMALSTAAVAFGFVVGYRFPAPWTAPIAAIATFIFLNYLDRTDGPLDRYSMTFTFIFYQVNTVPNVQLLLGLVVTILSVIVAVSVLLGAITGRSPWARMLVVTGVLLASGVVLVERSGPDDAALRMGGEARCQRERDVQLCVFSESAPQLAPMLSALLTAKDAAAPLFSVSSEFRQAFVSTSQSSPERVEVPANTERYGYLGRAVQAVVPDAPCPAYAVAGEDIAALIYERIESGSAASPEIRGLATDPLSDQRAWVAQRLRAGEAC